MPEFDVDGVAAMMALADRFGWGYVLFEDPAEVDFSQLEVEAMPAFSADTRWAAVSAGDFAFPHVITTHPAPNPVLRDPGLPMLAALFAQERLAGLIDRATTPVDDIAARGALEDALFHLERVPAAERAPAKPELLGELFESGTAEPLADGTVLTKSRGFQVVTSNAIVGELDMTDAYRFMVGAVGDGAASRRDCNGLNQGKVSVIDFVGFEIVPTGAAAVLSTRSDGDVLWALQPGEPGSCAWHKVGAIPPPTSGAAGSRTDRSGRKGLSPGPTGLVARPGSFEGMGSISVIDVEAGTSSDLGMVPGVRMSNVVWLTDHTLAAIGDASQGSGTWIVLVDTEVADTVLGLPASAVAGAHGLSALVPLPEGKGVVVAVDGDDRIYRVDFPRPVEQLFAAPPRNPKFPVVAAPGRPTVIELDPTGFVATPLGRTGARSLSISADGSKVVFSSAEHQLDPQEPGDGEIVLVDVQTGTEQILTRNAVSDREPRFTHDGQAVVFETRIDIPKTRWEILVPRLVKLAGPDSAGT